MSATVELALDARAALGEGAIWDARRGALYWVDILGHAAHCFDPATGQDRVFEIGQPVGTIVPRARGGVMLALRDGFAALDTDTGQLTMLVDPEAQLPGNRFNDGKCDPAGRFWAGTMPLQGGGATGALYCLDRDLSVRKMADGIRCSNGIAWSADARTMYYIDTPTQRVDAFDFDNATGAIANRRPVISVPAALGWPDGSTLDAEGMLWVAHWGGARVSRWNPRTGELLAEIQVPAPQVTSCAFGGPRLDQLYITTARTGLDSARLAEFPLAGGIFVATPGVQGVPAVAFAG